MYKKIGGLKKKLNKRNISFSIITVVLNQRKIIKNINSLKNQTYKNFEHIIIDGGSTDGTLDIIKKYNKNISYWESSKDKGIYDAMNKGLKKSRGNIIGILNSDDFYYKNALKVAKNYFNNEKIDFLFGTVKKDRVLHGFWPKKIKWKFNIYPAHSGGFFIRNKSQKKIGYYNLNYKYSSDRDLFYKMIVKYKMKGKCTNKSEILAKFSTQGISSKLSFFSTLFEELRIRINNRQNVFFVIFLFFIHSINKLINLFK